MDEKTQLLEEITKQAAAVTESIRNCDDPEFLVRAAKLIRKQIPFRYRRYAAAWFLIEKCSKPSFAKHSDNKAGSKTNQTPKPIRVTDGFVNLFVNAGKRNKINAADLSRHFGKILDIPLTKVATVKIFPAYSFIEIDAEDADRAVKKVSGTSLNNRKLTVSYSTKK